MIKIKNIQTSEIITVWSANLNTETGVITHDLATPSARFEHKFGMMLKQTGETVDGCAVLSPMT